MTGHISPGERDREEPAPAVRRIAVIPVYNEVETLAAVFDSVFAQVDMMIVVDDGSKDGSLRCITEWKRGRPGVHLLIHRKNRGMAAALRSGFLYAERLREDGTISDDDILINVDADGQHPVDEIPAAVGEMLEQNLDVLLVDRDFSLYPLYKVWGNRFLTALARIVSGFPYRDVESGFRFLRVRCLKLILTYYTGWKYSCAQEIAIITALHGLNISNNHPVRINYYRPGTTFSDGFAVLAMSLLAWLRVRFGLRNSPEKNRRLLAEAVAE